MPWQTSWPLTTTHPLEHVSSYEMVGAGLCAVGAVASMPAHALSVAAPAMAQASKIVRADRRFALIMEGSGEEGASSVRRDDVRDRYAE